MKVILNNVNQVLFKDISYGSCFKYNNRYCMKGCYMGTAYAIVLSIGEILPLTLDTEVEPIKLKCVEYYDV